MKKLLHIFIVFLMGFVFVGMKTPVFARSCIAPISNVVVEIPAGTASHSITIDLSSNFNPGEYSFEIKRLGSTLATSVSFTLNQNLSGNSGCNNDGCVTVQNNIVTWTITSQSALGIANLAGGNESKLITLLGPTRSDDCDLGSITILNQDRPGAGCTIRVFQNRGAEQCFLNQQGSSCMVNNVPVIVEVSNLKTVSGEPWNGPINLGVGQVGAFEIEWFTTGGQAINGNAVGANAPSFTPSTQSNDQQFLIQVKDSRFVNEDFPNCNFSITTKPGCNIDQCTQDTTLELGGVPVALTQEAFSLCKQIPIEFTEQRTACEACTGGTGEFEGNEGVWTAVGCIQRDPESIIQRLITVGLGMSGGVALLTFLAAGFIFSTSQGDPKAYGKAKEMMTASIVGIIFVIFSVTILQFIGYEILKIPGFGGS